MFKEFVIFTEGVSLLILCGLSFCGSYYLIETVRDLLIFPIKSNNKNENNLVVLV